MPQAMTCKFKGIAVTALTLPEILDRKAAATLAQQLMQHRGTALSLDAADVQRISGLGAEVLLAARYQWQIDGNAFGITNWSPEMAAMLSVLGAEVLQ